MAVGELLVALLLHRRAKVEVGVMGAVGGRAVGWVRLWLVSVWLVVVCGCGASLGVYVEVDAISPDVLRAQDYRLNPGDTVEILVWNRPKLSGERWVRPDGQVALPLVGDLTIAGKTPAEAAAAITKALDGLVVEPKVSVNVSEPRSPAVTVLGGVNGPGRYGLRHGDGVMDALAEAGGLSELANPDGIFVLRRLPQPVRVRFRYMALLAGEGAGPDFQLRDGDVLVVAE